MDESIIYKLHAEIEKALTVLSERVRIFGYNSPNANSALDYLMGLQDAFKIITGMTTTEWERKQDEEQQRTALDF